MANNEKKDRTYLKSLNYNLDYTKWDLGEAILWKKSGNYGKNGFVYTHPADIGKIKLKNFTDSKISWMIQQA